MSTIQPHTFYDFDCRNLENKIKSMISLTHEKGHEKNWCQSVCRQKHYVCTHSPPPPPPLHTHKIVHTNDIKTHHSIINNVFSVCLKCICNIILRYTQPSVTVILLQCFLCC